MAEKKDVKFKKFNNFFEMCEEIGLDYLEVYNMVKEYRASDQTKRQTLNAKDFVALLNVQMH